MNYALVYDTETTGFPLWKEPSSHPKQPHLVQLAAKLVCTETWRVFDAMSCIVKPQGWVIPPETVEIHGIDNHRAAELGYELDVVLSRFILMYRKCNLVVGHNVQFDDRIMRIAFKRWSDDNSFLFSADEFKGVPRFCTAKESTKIVNLPPTEKMKAAGRNTPKKPNLGEAYSYFTGQALKNAHDALVDVDACLEVFKGLNRKEEFLL